MKETYNYWLENQLEKSLYASFELHISPNWYRWLTSENAVFQFEFQLKISLNSIFDCFLVRVAVMLLGKRTLSTRYRYVDRRGFVLFCFFFLFISSSANWREWGERCVFMCVCVCMCMFWVWLNGGWIYVRINAEKHQTHLWRRGRAWPQKGRYHLRSFHLTPFFFAGKSYHHIPVFVNLMASFINIVFGQFLGFSSSSQFFDKIPNSLKLVIECAKKETIISLMCYL